MFFSQLESLSNSDLNKLNLLREYINNISNTNSLKDTLKEIVKELKQDLKQHSKNLKDKVVKIKMSEALKSINKLKSGAIIANSSHFNVEIDIESLEKESDSSKQILNSVKQYTLYDGRHIFLLGEGRLINLAAAEGHPSGVMDLSFAGQALAAEFINNNSTNLSNDVHALPTELDKEIALLKLQGMNVNIDVLSEEQEKYLNSWDIGT